MFVGRTNPYGRACSHDICVRRQGKPRPLFCRWRVTGALASHRGAQSHWRAARLRRVLPHEPIRRRTNRTVQPVRRCSGARRGASAPRSSGNTLRICHNARWRESLRPSIGRVLRSARVFSCARVWPVCRDYRRVLPRKAPLRARWRFPEANAMNIPRFIVGFLSSRRLKLATAELIRVKACRGGTVIPRRQKSISCWVTPSHFAAFAELVPAC